MPWEHPVAAGRPHWPLGPLSIWLLGSKRYATSSWLLYSIAHSKPQKGSQFLVYAVMHCNPPQYTKPLQARQLVIQDIFYDRYEITSIEFYFSKE